MTLRGAPNLFGVTPNKLRGVSICYTELQIYSAVPIWSYEVLTCKFKLEPWIAEVSCWRTEKFL